MRAGGVGQFFVGPLEDGAGYLAQNPGSFVLRSANRRRLPGQPDQCLQPVHVRAVAWPLAKLAHHRYLLEALRQEASRVSLARSQNCARFDLRNGGYKQLFLSGLEQGL